MVGIRLNMEMQKSMRVRIMKFAERMMASETQTSFGTKVRVCSCKLVMD